MNQAQLNAIADDLISVFALFHKHVMQTDSFNAKTDLSRSHLEVLFLLDDQGALAMSKIGEILYISKPYVTSLVDKLTGKGLVSRHLHETDRRITNIALTQAGKEFLELHKKELGSQIGAKLVNLDQSDLAELADSLLTLRKIMPHLTPK